MLYRNERVLVWYFGFGKLNLCQHSKVGFLLLLSNMEGIEALLAEAEALPLINGGGRGSPRELQLIVELATKW